MSVLHISTNILGFEPRGVLSTSLNKTWKIGETASGKCGVTVD